MAAKVHIYRHYRFINKDPVIDKLRTMMDDEGLSEYHTALIAGLSPGTVKNWVHGDTRKPQFASIAAATFAMGYELDFRKSKNRIDVDQELKAAAAEKLAKKTNGKVPHKIREFSW